MRRFVLAAVTVALSSAHAAEPTTAPGEPSFAAKPSDYRTQYDAFTREGQALRTTALHDEIERLDNLEKARRSMITRPEDVVKSVFIQTPDTIRLTAYAAVLQKRGEDGDPYASLFAANRDWDYCVLLRQSPATNGSKTENDCWQRVAAGMRRAAAFGLPEGSFAVARIYQHGLGVTSSKLVAADWFVRSAEQYHALAARDEALTATEKALDLVSDHPGALRMRRTLLK